MNEDVLTALARRVEALERQNWRLRAAAIVVAAATLAVVVFGVMPPKADAQRSPGPLTVEGGIYLTKHGVVRAQLMVDDMQGVSLTLFGNPAATGDPGEIDPSIVLTANPSETSINMGSSNPRSSIFLGTSSRLAPWITLYNATPSAGVELQGFADGRATVTVNGHFATIDDHRLETWRIPSADTP